MQPPLRVYHRQVQKLVEAPLSVGPDSRVYSPLLRTILVVREHDLRIINPQTGEPLLAPDEVQGAYLIEVAARHEAEGRAAHEATAPSRRAGCAS